MKQPLKKKVVFCWSGGKDSALALYKILTAAEYEIIALLTNISLPQRRVTMHGVREVLLDRQAESLGIPLVKMLLSEGSNNEYREKMRQLLLDFKAAGAKGVVFGDIFLEDLRKFRDANLEEVGLEGIYPLWKQDTNHLIREFLDLGFKTSICAADASLFNEDECGKIIGNEFIKSLNCQIDSCGENGEFHTFCHDGPIFSRPILFSSGETVKKEYTYKNDAGEELTSAFWFTDFLPL